jgi:hypothetical protein
MGYLPSNKDAIGYDFLATWQYCIHPIYELMNRPPTSNRLEEHCTYPSHTPYLYMVNNTLLNDLYPVRLVE